MGLNLFGNSWSKNEGYTPRPGNPDPSKFVIAFTEEINGNLIAVIHYPDAKNFEGIKILLYRGMTARGLKVLKVVDPHFSEDGVAPFARFEPTDAGMWAARQLAAVLVPESKERRSFMENLLRKLSRKAMMRKI